MRRFTVLLLVVAAAALAAPAAAGASTLIVRNATHITLKVNAKNRAVVSYRAKGIVRHVLVWGAINAKPPDPAHPDSQVKFHVDYSGGTASPWGDGYWRRVKNACTPLEGQRPHPGRDGLHDAGRLPLGAPALEAADAERRLASAAGRRSRASTSCTSHTGRARSPSSG